MKTQTTNLNILKKQEVLTKRIERILTIESVFMQSFRHENLHLNPPKKIFG